MNPVGRAEAFLVFVTEPQTVIPPEKGVHLSTSHGGEKCNEATFLGAS